MLLQEHTGVRRLEFLPHHFLLSSIGEGGVLRYQASVLHALLACMPYIVTAGQVVRHLSRL
jgi:U3 small nucleolar RNA-associated protein 7